MAETYVCRNCGRILLGKSAYERHLVTCGKNRPEKKCPYCGGTGVKAEFLGPNVKCPNCNGTGVV